MHKGNIGWFDTDGNMITAGNELYKPPENIQELNELEKQIKIVSLVQEEIRDEDGKTSEEHLSEAKDSLSALTQIAQDQQNNAAIHYQYLVKGALLTCRFGTHKRRINLPLCHGVYTHDHPLLHKFDCIVGGEYSNIEAFGVCNSDKNPSSEDVILKCDCQRDEHGELIGEGVENVRGKPCTPLIIGAWMKSHDTLSIRENMSSEAGNELYADAITTESFLVCRYGGIIEPVNSGQEYKQK